MHPGPDHMGGPGFASRRPNASSLPAFELPPPPLSSNQKYSYAVSGTQPPQAPGSLASVGNLLTPPSTVGGEGISQPPAGNVNTSSASTVPPYGNGGFAAWSPPNQSNPSYYTNSQRLPYSPATTVVRGHPHSPATSDGGQVPHATNYEVNIPPFQSSTPLSAPPTLTSMASHQQHAYHHMQNPMMGSQTPVSTTGPQASPIHAQEAFRPPPTPTYYSHQPSNTPQQSPFPYSTGPSPTQPSPLSAGGPMSGRPQMSPATGGPMPPLPAPPVQSPHAYQRPFAPFPTHGPVLSNINNPNGQAMLIGGLPHGMMHGFNSGHAAGLQQMYGNPPPQAQAQNDRPFKCDQCPQSFNRNHDLKRHKRIHLAVKPFPCGHCDKSFSRKDALKRHVLVKGCGKAQAAAEAEARDRNADSLSPKDKSTLSESSDHKSSVVAH